MNREVILQNLSQRFAEFGKAIGFNELFTDTESKICSEIYIVNKHALSISIDWRECTLEMYVVRMINGKLPNTAGTYHTCEDGRWARKRIAAAYQTQLPTPAGIELWSAEYLYFSYEFYTGLIRNNPQILFELLHSMDGPENVNQQGCSQDLVRIAHERTSANHKSNTMKTLNFSSNFYKSNGMQ